MPKNKAKISVLVAEKAIEILDAEFIEDLNPGWPKTYHDAISEAFTELQNQAKAFGSHLSWNDFDHAEAWAIIQKSRQCL